MTGSGHGGSAVTATTTGSAGGAVVSGGTAASYRIRLPRPSATPGKLRLMRVLARLTPDEVGRMTFVDMANAIRPGTLT